MITAIKRMTENVQCVKAGQWVTTSKNYEFKKVGRNTGDMLIFADFTAYVWDDPWEAVETITLVGDS